MKKHFCALVIVGLLLGACSASTLEKVKKDIAQAQEIVSAVNDVAQSLPQCNLTADAGADGK